jgi:phosphomevalonate kinase
MEQEDFKSVTPESNDSSANSANLLHKKDKIDKNTRDKIRKLKKVNIKEGDRYVFKIEISEMQEMLDTFSGDGATTLIFDLGSYQDQADCDRYNKRNGNIKKWKLKDFDNCLTVIIGGDGNNVGLLNYFYDAVEMCPPPSDGSCGYPFD